MDDKQLASLKPGDRVRLTFEGVIEEAGYGAFSVMLDGGVTETNYDEHDLPAITCEVLSKPLAVGDCVVVTHNGPLGNILAINGHQAWVEFSALGTTDIYSLALLMRVDKEA